MSVFTENFSLDQGADFTFTSQPYVLNGVIQNLTGAHCRTMLRVQPSDASPVVSLTDSGTANGSVIPNGATGTVTLTITKVATSAISPGAVYQYDTFVDLPGGTSVKLLTGTMTITPSVTH